MDIKMAAQTIRDTVSMDQILSLYGYRTRKGFMVCPFHGEKTPSLKVYTGRNGHSGWHCFGCHRGGSVIDFVQEHEGCDFRTAVRAIDDALSLHLFPERENPWKLEEQRRIQDWLDEYVETLYGLCDVTRMQINARMVRDMQKMKRIRDMDVQDRSAQEWTFLATFDEENQYNEYLLDKVEEFREVVAAWRRKARKAKPA